MVAMVQEPVQLLHQVRGLSALLASMNTSDWDALDGEQARVLLGELAQALARINAHQIAGARVVEKANLARKHGEVAARAKTRLELVDNRDGTHSGRFTIPDLAAAQLKAALQALAAPRRDHLRDDTPTDFPHRMGIAFTDLLGLLPTGDLPVHGGVSATVTVRPHTRIPPSRIRHLATQPPLATLTDQDR